MADDIATEIHRHDHDGELVESFDGWAYVECSCGWSAGPFPGRVEASDELVDHMLEVRRG